MLASPQVQHLVETAKINRALGGGLLPLNNNRCYFNMDGISSVTVVQDDPLGATPVALGVFSKCSANQLYCSLAITCPEYEKVFVNAERVKSAGEDLGLVGEEDGEDDDEKAATARHSIIKITEVVEELADRSGLPQYYSAFFEPEAKPLLQCMIDELIEKTVGHCDVDVKRNITVDLYDTKAGIHEHPDDLWRDYSGFVVGDRFRYCEVEIAKEDFLSVLVEAANDYNGQRGEGLPFEIDTVTKDNFDHVLDYDQNLTVMNRQSHLEYLFNVCRVPGSVAINAHREPVGYIFSCGNHILQCYAENEAVVSCLLKTHIEKKMAREKEVTAFMRFDNQWMSEKFAARATKVRRVRRFHTRIVPNSVKDHSKIFIYNMGVHLF